MALKIIIIIKAAAAKTNNVVVTVEDHYAEGGLGDAVAGELSCDGVKVHKLAVRELPRSGKAEELLAKFGIDAAEIGVVGANRLAGARIENASRGGCYQSHGAINPIRARPSSIHR